MKGLKREKKKNNIEKLKRYNKKKRAQQSSKKELNEAQWSSRKVKGAQGADQGSSFELIGLMVGQNKE